MKIRLSQITIDTSNIKTIYNKYKKLQAGTKTIRPHYCIEFTNGNFMEINKKEYKLLEDILKKERRDNMMYNPNILDEGNQMEILEQNEDQMKMIIRCNNCGQPTEYGYTRMISGFVGCDNKIIVNGKEVECYFDDLMPRVMDWKENHYELYRTGKVYRWRDGIDGGINERN